MTDDDERIDPIEAAAQFIRQAKAFAADGITWREFGEMLVSLLKLLVAAYDRVASLSGDQKKALVLEAAGRLFDAVADSAVPLAAYPIWILARPAVRALVLAIASGAVESLLPLVRAV